MKLARVLFFQLAVILFSLFQFGCSAPAGALPDTAGRDLLLTEGAARVDLGQIATDAQPWIVVKLNINMMGGVGNGPIEHSTRISSVRATATLISSLENSSRPVTASKWDLAWTQRAVVSPSSPPIDDRAPRSGVYLAKLNAANEIETSTLTMIPDDWADKIKPALDFQAAHPTLLRPDSIIKSESLVELLNDSNPAIALQAWRVLCAGEPSQQLITYRLSQTRGVLQGASLVVLAVATEQRQIELRFGVRPVIESARSPEDVYGLALGSAIHFSNLLTDDITTRILARPALIDGIAPTGRANRTILESIPASHALKEK